MNQKHNNKLWIWTISANAACKPPAIISKYLMKGKCSVLCVLNHKAILYHISDKAFIYHWLATNTDSAHPFDYTSALNDPLCRGVKDRTKSNQSLLHYYMLLILVFMFCIILGTLFWITFESEARLANNYLMMFMC